MRRNSIEFRIGRTPRYGWEPRGKDVPGHPVYGAQNQMAISEAIAAGGVRACITIESGTLTNVFVTFIEQVLGPKLCYGDLVVMNNLPAHESITVLAALARVGAMALFWPYAPQ